MSDYKDYAARRLRPEERRGIMHMDMLSRSFRLAACDLGKRLEGYRYLSRDIGMMQSVCRRLIEHAMENVEPEMRAQVLRQSRDYTLGLERIAAARREDEVVMPIFQSTLPTRGATKPRGRWHGTRGTEEKNPRQYNTEGAVLQWL